MVSQRVSRNGSLVRIEINEKMQETVKMIAITDVNSSIKCVSVQLPTFNEVITKRQNPRRFAETLKICCEVLFDIMQK